MAILYLDTSALLKLFIREPGTQIIVGLVSDLENRLAISSLAPVEFRSAIRRRVHSGDLANYIAQGLLDHFDLKLAEIFLQQPVTDAVINQAIALVDHYNLRTLDSLQLASCKALQASVSSAPIFVCSDHNLIEAAAAEKLSCVNPLVPKSEI